MIVLTLVHGTWGRGMFFPSGDAPWTTETSALSTSLRNRFGPDVAFRRFRWSGRNTHTARVAAAMELRRCLQRGFEDWPDARHLIIAHSHGGNVALAALDDSGIRERIAGVACLATPFIAARKRDLGKDPLRTFAAAILVLVFALLWFGNKLLPSSWNDPVRLTIAVLVGSALASVFLLMLSGVRRHAARLERELTAPPLSKERLLIVRSAGDEASGAIGLFQFISQVTVRLFLVAESWHAKLAAVATRWALHKKRLIVIAAAAFVVAPALLVPYAKLTTAGAPPWLANLALTGFFASVVLSAAATYLRILGPDAVMLVFRLLVSALVWPVIAILSIVLAIPFGWQAGVANILLDVTAEATPTGTWEVNLVEPPTSEALDVPVAPWMHTVYENPRVQEKIGQWIEDRTAAAPPLDAPGIGYEQPATPSVRH